MSVPYDKFTEAFLAKITEYNFANMDQFSRTSQVDGYMKRAIAAFRTICLYDFATTADDIVREFEVDVPEDDLYEIADIISEGMVVQWLKPYTFRQENMELYLNTKDYNSAAASGMLRQMSAVHKEAERRFTNMMNNYSYRHGDLTEFHL